MGIQYIEVLNDYMSDRFGRIILKLISLVNSSRML